MKETVAHCALDEDRIVESLKRDGLARIEAFVAGSGLASLRGEFDLLLHTDLAGVKLMKSHPSGPAARVGPKGLAAGRLPGMRALFESPALKRIARSYMPAGSATWGDIVATHDVIEVKISDIHFDLTRALKFFLYLGDTDESNGFLSYALGTHRQNARDREHFLAAGGRFRELANIAAVDEHIDLTPLPGAAGTLLIFDTEGWHAAGTVKQGLERSVLRAARIFDQQPTSRPAILSRQWLRESPLNPMRVLRGQPSFPGRQSTGGKGRADRPALPPSA